MHKWPGAPFSGSMHPADAQNKTLISNIGIISQSRYQSHIENVVWSSFLQLMTSMYDVAFLCGLLQVLIYSVV